MKFFGLTDYFALLSAPDSPSANADVALAAAGSTGGDQKVRDFLSCVLQYMSSRQQGQNNAEQANTANGQRVSQFLQWHGMNA